MNDGDDFPDVQDVIDEYLELIERELKNRGVLYEKYGSAIRTSLRPLWQLVVVARNDHSTQIYEFLKEFVSE